MKNPQINLKIKIVIIPPVAAAIEVADIGLAHDGDGFRGSVFIFGIGGIWCRISSFLVAGRSSGSNV